MCKKQIITLALVIFSTIANASPFDQAFIKFGFHKRLINQEEISIERQEEDVLKIFYLAGYLAPQKLWQDINHITTIKDKKTTFISIMQAIEKAGGSQSQLSKFDAAKLRESFGYITLTDEWMDLLLYIAQHAFNRAHGQERNEIKTLNWMEIYKVEYKDIARELGLVDRYWPKDTNYDAAWIAGASRAGLLARVKDLEFLQKNNIQIKDNNISILAGERELWAEIDGLNPSTKQIETEKIINIDKLDIFVPVGRERETIEEGKNYMLYLAKRHNIPFDTNTSFIEYKVKEEAPIGRFPGRVYLKTLTDKKVTETLMAEDLLEQYFILKSKVIVVDTKSENNTRPTTSSTGRDAAEAFVKKIISGVYGEQKKFQIIFESNNPYIERQAIATQREVDFVLKKHGLDKLGYVINIEGVGFACKQDVPTIHSEFGALIAEMWKYAHIGQENSQNLFESLSFQTRDKTNITIEMPDYNV